MRLSPSKALRPFLMFLMLAGYLRPGYDYLLARKLASVLREAPASPLGDQLARFLAAAAEPGYSEQVRLGMASLVTMRLLIQAGGVLTSLTDADIATFDEAITVRERDCGRSLKHYRTALYATRAVIYHLGGALTPAAAKDTAHLRWEWARYFEGVHGGIAASLCAYLECACGTRTRSTVSHMAGRLASFARVITGADPALACCWRARTASSTSSLTWLPWPRPATPAPARPCPPRSGAAGSSPPGG